MKAVPRDQASALSRLLRTFPAVLVFGPRQSGKSTLLRAALSGWRLVDLVPWDEIRSGTFDPR